MVSRLSVHLRPLATVSPLRATSVILLVVPIYLSVFRRSMQLAYQRRWWSLLSVALHNSIATALDPSLDIAEGTLPVASAIDVWVRDPPAVSSLPARGE